MLFAHDTNVSLAMVAALVNTAGEPDELATVTDVTDFLRRWELTGRIDGDEAELAAMRRLRDRLRGLFGVDEEAVATGVNALLREGRALPQVVRHDHWSWHLHATDSDRPAADRIGVEAAMALADVLRAQEADRMRLCAAPDCDGVLVDLSRNRSRRFCSTTCGNRVAAAAYRARQAGQAGQAGQA